MARYGERISRKETKGRGLAQPKISPRRLGQMTGSPRFFFSFFLRFPLDPPEARPTFQVEFFSRGCPRHTLEVG